MSNERSAPSAEENKNILFLQKQANIIYKNKLIYFSITSKLIRHGQTAYPGKQKISRCFERIA